MGGPTTIRSNKNSDSGTRTTPAPDHRNGSDVGGPSARFVAVGTGPDTVP